MRSLRTTKQEKKATRRERRKHTELSVFRDGHAVVVAGGNLDNDGRFEGLQNGRGVRALIVGVVHAPKPELT
jgi:hypothetical protein